MTIHLRARALDFAYAERPVLHGVTLELAAGQLAALVGPNGSGKTTLLRLLDGILRPTRGVVELEDQDLRRIPARALARRLALVPQDRRAAFGFTVREMVMLGRTPYARALAGPSRTDRRIVEEMLRLTGTAFMADRLYSALSGGEQQRVAITMALAQEPQVLLLDEPTVHLDINHQVEVLELVRRLNRERGLSVLATMHDLNLAALYFDRVFMIQNGCLVAQGTPTEVLTAERIQAVFHARVAVQPHPTRAQTPQLVVIPPAE